LARGYRRPACEPGASWNGLAADQLFARNGTADFTGGGRREDRGDASHRFALVERSAEVQARSRVDETSKGSLPEVLACNNRRALKLRVPQNCDGAHKARPLANGTPPENLGARATGGFEKP
jgi:hypothetical protein